MCVLKNNGVHGAKADNKFNGDCYFNDPLRLETMVMSFNLE